MPIIDNTIIQEAPKRDRKLRTRQVVAPSDVEALTIPDTGVSNSFFDFQSAAGNEFELINKYLSISTYPDVFRAIEEITTEAIAALDSEMPVELDVSGLHYSDKFKNILLEEFDIVMKLLDFKNKAHDIFRLFYITGKCGYQIIMNKDKGTGIEKLVFIDPRKFRKVRIVHKKKMEDGTDIIDRTEDIFIYSNTGTIPALGPITNYSETTGSNLRIPVHLIAYACSGLYDPNQGMVLSFLQPALKPANQLAMLKDAMVISRIVRAPMRRMFKIDVSKVPKNKADQYIRTVISRYKNKMIYNSVEGTVKDQRHLMSVLEDYWFPVDSEGHGHSVENLEGVRTSDDINDIDNIQDELYRALQIPPNRYRESSVVFGRQTEVSRDELTFSKFINRLRRKFNSLFDDILRTNLVDKGIISESDWEEIRDAINYKYKRDQYFLEIKEMEIIRNRLDMVNQAYNYMGVLYSKEYINKHILKFSDEQIKEMKEQMEADHIETMERQLNDQQFLGQGTGDGDQDGEGQEDDGSQGEQDGDDAPVPAWSPPPRKDRISATQAAQFTQSITPKKK